MEKDGEAWMRCNFRQSEAEQDVENWNNFLVVASLRDMLNVEVVKARGRTLQKRWRVNDDKLEDFKIF